MLRIQPQPVVLPLAVDVVEHVLQVPLVPHLLAMGRRESRVQTQVGLERDLDSTCELAGVFPGAEQQRVALPYARGFAPSPR